jgi:hypothetical protein
MSLKILLISKLSMTLIMVYNGIAASVVYIRRIKRKLKERICNVLFHLIISLQTLASHWLFDAATHVVILVRASAVEKTADRLYKDLKNRYSIIIQNFIISNLQTTKSASIDDPALVSTAEWPKFVDFSAFADSNSTVAIRLRGVGLYCDTLSCGRWSGGCYIDCSAPTSFEYYENKHRCQINDGEISTISGFEETLYNSS